MLPGRNLTPDEIRAIASEGRVKRHPRYHAHEHNVRFRDLVGALLFCQHVLRDRRTDGKGNVRHPRGFVAWSNQIRGQVWRVDFDLEEDGDGEWALIVTGFEVK